MTGILSVFIGINAAKKKTAQIVPVEKQKKTVYQKDETDKKQEANKAENIKNTNEIKEKDQETGRDLTPLKESLVKEAGEEKVSVFVLDLKTGSSFDIHNRKMQAASLIKLFIAGAVYENYLPTANYLTEDRLKREMKEMITVSNNDSANCLVRALGAGSEEKGMEMVNTYCVRHKFTDTHMGRMLMSPKKTADNMTSVKDTGEFLRLVYNNEISGAEEIADLMEKQTRVEKIPAGLPENVICANKTGELRDVENDAAIVYGDTPYVLTVMWEDVSEPGNTRKKIAALSKEVYDFLR